MTVTASVAPATTIPSQRTTPRMDVIGKYDQDDYAAALAERDEQLLQAAHAEYAAFIEDNAKSNASEPAPTMLDELIKAARFAHCRLVAMTKRWASRSEKQAPPKDIELTGSVNRQIWVAKELKRSTDWNRVMFDNDSFNQFNLLVANMPTGRRRWFRQRFCFAGVAA